MMAAPESPENDWSDQAVAVAVCPSDQALGLSRQLIRTVSRSAVFSPGASPLGAESLRLSSPCARHTHEFGYEPVAQAFPAGHFDRIIFDGYAPVTTQGDLARQPHFLPHLLTLLRDQGQAAISVGPHEARTALVIRKAANQLTNHRVAARPGRVARRRGAAGTPHPRLTVAKGTVALVRARITGQYGGGLRPPAPRSPLR
jgi:hypothetical protein